MCERVGKGVCERIDKGVYVTGYERIITLTSGIRSESTVDGR